MNTKSNPYKRELIEHMLAAKDATSMERCLDDLLTPSELTEICKRLQIFKLLEAGVPQRRIAEQLNVGIATVTRGSRTLKEKP